VNDQKTGVSDCEFETNMGFLEENLFFTKIMRVRKGPFLQKDSSLRFPMNTGQAE
jgi:hypothetical protein